MNSYNKKFSSGYYKRYKLSLINENFNHKTDSSAFSKFSQTPICYQSSKNVSSNTSKQMSSAMHNLLSSKPDMQDLSKKLQSIQENIIKNISSQGVYTEGILLGLADKIVSTKIHCKAQILSIKEDLAFLHCENSYSSYKKGSLSEKSYSKLLKMSKYNTKIFENNKY